MLKFKKKTFGVSLNETIGNRNPFGNTLGSCRGNRAIGNLLETVLNVDIPAATGHCGVSFFQCQCYERHYMQLCSGERPISK